MEDRYKKMSKVGVRNIDGFNARVAEAAAKNEIITNTHMGAGNPVSIARPGEAIYEQEEEMERWKLPILRRHRR